MSIGKGTRYMPKYFFSRSFSSAFSIIIPSHNFLKVNVGSIYFLFLRPRPKSLIYTFSLIQTGGKQLRKKVVISSLPGVISMFNNFIFHDYTFLVGKRSAK